MFRELVLKNRSYRRFYQNEAIRLETLKELVDLARLTPSAANRQPLKYIISCDKDFNAKIFPSLAWAGYLADWPGPEEGERPTGYIIILGDTEISKVYNVDPGITAQTILLGAAEKGLGGCMIASLRKEQLIATLELPDRYDIQMVIALGKPKEEVVLENMDNGDVKYYRDENQVHHVPKRSFEEIIVNTY